MAKNDTKMDQDEALETPMYEIRLNAENEAPSVFLVYSINEMDQGERENKQLFSTRAESIDYMHNTCDFRLKAPRNTTVYCVGEGYMVLEEMIDRS